jgi:hypothetical protein
VKTWCKECGGGKTDEGDWHALDCPLRPRPVGEAGVVMGLEKPYGLFEPVTVTPEMRSAVASELAKKRWAKPAWKSKKKRAAFGKYVSSHGAGRPRESEDRCPCGEMTRERAEKRNHRCQATDQSSR